MKTWTPASRAVEGVTAAVPELQVPVPTAMSLSMSVTMAEFSQEILSVGVVSVVRLSVAEAPVSDAAARSGVPGAEGAVASIVTERPEEEAEVCPAGSVWVAVRE